MNRVSRDRRVGYSGQQPATGFMRWVRVGILLALIGWGWMAIRADAEEAPSVLAQPGSDGIGHYRLVLTTYQFLTPT